VQKQRLILGLLVLLAGVLTTAGHASAGEAGKEKPPAVERKPWNQEEMVTLTTGLAGAVREVRDAWRKEPASRESSGPKRATTVRITQTLRDLDQRTSALATRVENGAGYDETLGVARKINVLLRDLDEQARGVMTSAWMDEKVKPAMDLINQIAPYYGREALYDTESMQRLDRPPNPKK